MKHDDTENKLRHLFHALRDYDTRRALPFDRPCHDKATAHGKVPVKVTWLRLVAVGSVLIAFGLLITLLHFGIRRPSEDSRQWASLTQWQASTDSLMHVMSTPWSGSTVMTVTDSWIDSSSSVTETTQ